MTEHAGRNRTEALVRGGLTFMSIGH